MFKFKTSALYQLRSFLRPYQKLVLQLLVVMVLASSLGMLLPWTISQRLLALTNLDTHTLLQITIAILVIISFHHVFWFLWSKLGAKLSFSLESDLRLNLVKHLLNTQLEIANTQTSGYYIERIKEDVVDVASYLTQVMGSLVDALTNLSFLVIVFTLNLYCGLLLSFVILLLYGIDTLKLKQDLSYQVQLKALNEQVVTSLQEISRGLATIQGFHLQDSIAKKNALIYQEIAVLSQKKAQHFALLSRVKTFIQHGFEAFMFVFAIIYLIPTQALTLVLFLTVLNYLGFLYDLVDVFANIQRITQLANLKADRIIQLLTPTFQTPFGHEHPNDLEPSLTLNHLQFAYHAQSSVLKDISLIIPAYTTTLITGSSGSGKSTLFALLSKRLVTADAQLSIGDVPMNKFTEEALRETISLIDQEPFLFHDTIMNNLRITHPETSEETVYDLCHQLNCFDDFCALPDGFETLISEHSTNLSGGQKQRIALVRALLKGTPIMLFDEPTSALDHQNQTAFLSAIALLRHQKTIIIISHKPMDESHFDQIYHLKKGQLVKNK